MADRTVVADADWGGGPVDERVLEPAPSFAGGAGDLAAARPRILALDGLRGLLALYVALYHLSNTFEHLKESVGRYTFILENGWYAVDVFFLMSGFVIAYVYRDWFADGIRLGDLKRFWIARVTRLYPVHLFTLAILALVIGPLTYGTPLGASGGRYAWDALLANLVMLQGPWVPQRTWNYPSWSISAEWHAYALFPLLGLLVRGRVAASLAVIVGTAIPFGFYLTLPSVAEAPTNGLVTLLRVLPLFLAGMGLFELRRLALFSSPSVAAALCIATIGCLTNAALAPVALLLAPPLVLATIGGSGLTRTLERPTLVWLGEISYSLYMVHALVQVFVANRIEKVLAAHGPASLSLSLLSLIASLALAVVAAVATHRYVELPSRRWLLKRAVATRKGAQ